MNDVRQAVSQISLIRAQLAATTQFRGYVPEIVALIGFAALAIMVAQLVWLHRLAADNRQQVLIAGALLIVSGLTILVEAIGRSRKQHGRMAGAMLQGAIRLQLPIGLLGAMVAATILTFAPEAVWILPGVWQMLIGIVAFASLPTMPRAVIWPALWYIAAGSAVMWIAGTTTQLTPVTTLAPLGIGHLAIAWVLHHGRVRPS